MPAREHFWKTLALTTFAASIHTWSSLPFDRAIDLIHMAVASFWVVLLFGGSK